MKNILFYTIIVLMGAFLIGCSPYEPIELESIKDYEIQNLENNQMDLITEIEIKNPNNYLITLSADSFLLHLNDSVIGKAYILNDIALTPKSKEIYVLKTHLELRYDLATTAMQFGLNPLKHNNTLHVYGIINGKAKWINKEITVDENIPLNMKDLFFF